jgi:tetratricopeptide (TPR) repeat protein
MAGLSQAVAQDQKAGDARAEAQHLDSLGLAHLALDDPREAAACFQRALEAVWKVRDRRCEARVLGHLGAAYHLQGQIRGALTGYYEPAMKIAHEVGERETEATNARNCGRAHLDLDQPQDALTCYKSALSIDQEAGNCAAQAADLQGLADAHLRLGQAQEAIPYLKQALATVREGEDEQTEGGVLTGLGVAYAAVDNAAEARAYLLEALAVWEELASPRAGEVRELLAGLGDRTGDEEGVPPLPA